MEFFANSVNALQTITTGLGALIGVWGLIGLMEGYGSDNAGAKSQGIKQLAAGAGIAFIGITLIPQLSSIF